MKLMVAALLMSSVALYAGDDHGVKVLSTKMDIVYLKVPPNMIGAVLTVYDNSGSILTVLPVNGKKVVIDFLEAKPGDYVIHIERCDHVEEVKYHRA